jgi:hypothetical protein
MPVSTVGGVAYYGSTHGATASRCRFPNSIFYTVDESDISAIAEFPYDLSVNFRKLINLKGSARSIALLYPGSMKQRLVFRLSSWAVPSELRSALIAVWETASLRLSD